MLPISYAAPYTLKTAVLCSDIVELTGPMLFIFVRHAAIFSPKESYAELIFLHSGNA